MAVSGANQYRVRPVRVGQHRHAADARGLQAASRGGRSGGPATATDAPSTARAATDTAATAAAATPVPGTRARRPAGAARRRQARQGREGSHLDHPGDDPRGRPDLLEPEQADPQGQEVAAQGGQGEPGAGRRGEPCTGRQHRGTEPEGRDHLEQEQPADRRDRPVAGQVQVKVNRARRDQQPAPGQPQGEPCPGAAGWPLLLRHHVLLRQPAVTRPLSTRRHRTPMTGSGPPPRRRKRAPRATHRRTG